MHKKYTLRAFTEAEQNAQRAEAILDQEALRLAGVVIARVVTLMAELRDNDKARQANAREAIDRLHAAATAAGSTAAKKRLPTLLASTDNAMFLVRAVALGAGVLDKHGDESESAQEAGVAAFEFLERAAPAVAKQIDFERLKISIRAWNSATSTKKKSKDSRRWPAMLALARSVSLCLNIAEADHYRKLYSVWTKKHPDPGHRQSG